jgi:hypothetical protein
MSLKYLSRLRQTPLLLKLREQDWSDLLHLGTNSLAEQLRAPKRRQDHECRRWAAWNMTSQINENLEWI